MDEALNIIRNKAEKTVWNKVDGSVRILDKSDLCPISKNWLIPANCTEIKPPQVEEGYRLFFEDNEWHIEKTEEEQEKEIKAVQGSVIDSLQDQIKELQSQIEQLKFEKEEIKLDMRLEKERLLDDIANSQVDIIRERTDTQNQINEFREQVEELRNEKEELKKDLDETRLKALEISANLILQKGELKKDTEGVDDNGFKTDI